MKNIFHWYAYLATLAIFVYFGFNTYTRLYSSPQPPMPSAPVTIVPISHATAVLKWGSSVLYTDPVDGSESFAGQPAATIVLVTDIHGDHFNTSTLASVVGSAKLIVPQVVKDELTPDLAARSTVLKNGETISVNGFTVEGIPMYNLPGPSEKYHTKGRGNGYVVEKDGYRVYIAGDTAGIPEMRALQNIDIALVPINLPYTMSVDEAADAVLAFKPKHVYPYHYRQNPTKDFADVQKFKQLVNAKDASIDVVLLNWYPSAN